MGAICGEESMKWEKMQALAGIREEKILVLVRLRPLSEKEISRNEASDWECINATTILYRNSLQERSGLPTAYVFDRVFRGDNLTRQVYEEGAKEIALSVVGGINSTIFAYGQTSSGKTYTMNGITEYTVADIYDYIQRHEERAFVLKFSAIEIYNEVVRDLLSTDNTPLRILDDLEKGTIVEKLTEEILRDWSHLKELLSICEAQRQIGETSLNETSSRSHQILRLTIESSAREFLGKDNSTTLSASVNFVDLAGSERASQSLSVGQRLKEGCHINRSLLTLGTVIRKLSKGRNGHVNYRDSKLTRILQPSLGGNARTAIICTLSPARSHVEQSRNTLLFASCAKEVSTNAKVNVVMSDKALVKHLQKELARLESELRTPIPASDYTSLLRKKDMKIEKLEKEVRELTKQRDLAQSRVEDLLQLVSTGQTSRKWDCCDHHPKWEEETTCEDEDSVTYSSVGTNHHCKDMHVRNLNANQSSNRDPWRQVRGGSEDPLLSDGTSSLSNRGKFDRSDLSHCQEEFDQGAEEDFDDICKEVRCIEMDEVNKDKNTDSHTFSNDENEGTMSESTLSGIQGGADEEVTSMLPREASHSQNSSTYGLLEQKIQDVQKTINSLVRSSPDELSVGNLAGDMPSSRSLKLTRSWSCRAKLMTSSSSPEFRTVDPSDKTPPSGHEENFPGRPEGFQRKHWKLPPLIYGAETAMLSSEDSQSSMGSAFIEDLKGQNKKNSAEEDIPSIDSFIAGMKEMTKLQCEQKLDDFQVQGRDQTAEKYGRNVKDVGLDPMQEPSGSPFLEFDRLQKLIIELWQNCNVSLVHRTYFFLLFKGDSMDSIYMEVEFRRLSFLKETFSKGNRALQDNQTVTLTSSTKALCREREMLCRLMSKRFSEEERDAIYQKWGVGLDSKQRRLQLVRQLWSDTKDMNHITESAAIVAKLIRFSEEGQALKEMFGLSFTPPRLRRRSFGWKHSMALLL